MICKNCKWFENAEWVIGAKSKNIDKWAKKLIEDGYGDCMNTVKVKLKVIAGKKHGRAHLFFHESFGCIHFERREE